MATITSATSGNSNATGTWTGGVVPVSGDKVIIAHPGTNNLSSTPYVLNGAASLGATTIPVTGGTGTIVAGECVQFEHQIGTDEDGLPIYDNTYYRVTTGITGNGSLVITPGLAYAMASGVRVTNRGHVVTLEASHTWGDDTSSTAALNSNAIAVSGTLRASRSVNTDLTCRGTLYVGTGGTLDYGYPGQEALTVTARIKVNDSATLAIGKHGLIVGSVGSSQSVKMAGIVRTRNTSLTGSIVAGATSISVAQSAGWAIGDVLVIASDTDDPARSQKVTITGGSSPTWTTTAITNARASATRVGNLTSNVLVESMSGANPGIASFSANFYDFRVSDVLFLNMGSGSGWVGASQNSPRFYGAISFASSIGPRLRARRLAVNQDSTVTSGPAIAFDAASLQKHGVVDAAVWCVTGKNAVFCGGISNPRVENICIYSSSVAFIGSFGGGSRRIEVSGGAAWGANLTSTSELTTFVFENFDGKSSASVFSTGGGYVEYLAGSVSSPTRLMSSGSNAGFGVVKLRNTSILSAASSGSLISGLVPVQESIATIDSQDGNASDNRVRSYYQETATDLTTRKRSTYSVKIQPKVANTAITYTFTLPGVAGVAQTIKGALRFDGTYGTANPPSIVLAGQGVSQSFTAPATADAWHDFTLTFTPTSTGDITATVTVQSASTSGFAWLDGVYHYPMTQSARHFGFQFLPQTALVADSRITVSEATALAYPVSVNHATDTITLTGNATARQIFEACIADLCQTANQSEPVHITSATGDTFTTTYTVNPAGFTITGPYTDAAGLHVNIRADALLSGSRVQLYNVTDATELLNTETTGAGLVFPIIAPGAAKTIRLRVAKVGYLPIEAFGVLDGASVAFLDSQVADAVYNAIGLDGSTVTEFTPDYPNLQIDANDADGVTTVQRVYAWSRWANTTADGIRLMHNAVQAQDSANFLIDVGVVNARFDNNSATPLVIAGGYIRRSDGSTVIGEGVIQMDPGRAYVAAGASAITVPAGERVITLATTGEVFARA